MINRMKMHRFLSVWQTAINIPSRPIFLLPVLCTSKGSREKAFFLRPGQPKEGGLREGLLTCTKSDEFSRKNTTAPPSFSENYVANFLWWIWLHICKEVWWPDSMHMISRDRDHSEGWGVGVNCSLGPFRKFIRFGSVIRSYEKFYKEALHQL